MELRRLPLDGIRPILKYLNAQDIAMLNAVFDLSIHTLLSYPGAVDADIVLDSDAIHGPMLYLLRTLMNVRHVLMPDQADLSLENLLLLKTLNPLTLTIKGRVVSNTALAQILDPDSSFSEDDMRHFVMRDRIPNLQLLTPRLEALDLDLNFGLLQEDLKEKHYLFPPTLTAITLRNVVPSDPLLKALPPTVSALKVLPASNFDWNPIFMSLRNLHELTLEGVHYYKPYDLQLPSRLTSAAFLCSNSHSASTILASLRGSQLSTLKLTFDVQWHETGFETPTITSLPPTLSCLTIWSNYTNLLEGPLPSQLLSLTVQLTEKAWLSLPSLHLLQKLILTPPPSSKELCLVDTTTSWEGDPVCLSASILPPSLNHLELPANVSMISDAAIRLLPPSLCFLSTYGLQLSSLHLVRSRAPKCRLLLKSVDFGSRRSRSDMDVTIFPQIWQPTLETGKWLNCVSRRYSSIDAHLEPSQTQRTANWSQSPETTTLIVSAPPTPLQLLLSSMNDLSNLLKALPRLTTLIITEGEHVAGYHLDLSFLPPTATHLELANLSVLWSNVDESAMPPIQYLSVSSPLTLESLSSNSQRALMSCLKHLDAPRLSLSGKDACSWRLTGMTKFRFAKLYNIDDFQVVDFLTSALDAPTRSNMSFSLIYNVTGALTPDSGPGATKTVDLNIIKSATETFINEKLASPAQLKRSFFAPKTPTDCTAIGSGLTSVTASITRSYAHFVLPKSATDASIVHSSTTWALAHFDSKLGSLHDFRYFPPGLVRLELVGVIDPFKWWHLLPLALRHLRVASTPSFSKFWPSNFPPKLETLSLEYFGTSSWGDDGLVISLESLPASLERLAIISPRLKLSAQDESLDPKSTHLSNLHWIVASDPGTYTAYILHDIIASKPNAEFHVVDVFLQEYDAPTTNSSIRNPYALTAVPPKTWSDTDAFYAECPLISVKGSWAKLQPSHIALLQHPLREQPIEATTKPFAWVSPLSAPSGLEKLSIPPASELPFSTSSSAPATKTVISRTRAVRRK